ncbi:MAG: hypothetical protein IJ268_00710 [Proteobacteria bacterium]|nr:hypothetical protein [Pseudomonadota bacterium]
MLKTLNKANKIHYFHHIPLHFSKRPRHHPNTLLANLLEIMKRFFSLVLPFVVCCSLSACSLRNHTTDSEHHNSSDSAQAEISRNIDKRCKTAIDELEWKDVNHTEAAQACQLLHEFMLENFGQYKKVIFIAPPASPYYFIRAYVEREINPTYVIHAQNGIIPKNSTEAIQEFAKHIDILNTTLDAKSLAYMIYGFHSGNIETLILEHHDGDEYDPEMNPPEFHKNDDGSASLTYELMSTGRATIVKPFVLTISPDYQITLARNTKEAPTTP